MTFQIGQEVVVRKALGDKSGYGRGHYYHGGNLKQFPLGAKGVIDDVENSTLIHIRFENKRYGEMYVHPEELGSVKTNSTTRTKEDSALLKQLEAKEPLDKKVGETREFNPRFNPREEFAVWIRQEFPDIKDRVNRGKPYEQLEARKAEIIEGARKAYKHAMRTATGCARTGFIISFARLRGDTRMLQMNEGRSLDYQGGEVRYYYMSEEDRNCNKDKVELFPKFLDKFVTTIERSSRNLDSSTKHYGTEVIRR